MRRLWSPSARVEMPFIAPKPPESAPPLETKGLIDIPEAGEKIEAETITILGWVAFGSGPTNRVEIWLGEHQIGRARVGLLRPDVAEVSDAPYASISGFELPVDLNTLPSESREGETVLRAVARGPGDERFELNPVPIVLSKPDLEPDRMPPPPLPPASKSPGRIRTMVVTHQLNLGGAQLYLLDALRGLYELGAIDPVVISSIDGSVRDDLEELGIPVHMTNMFPSRDLASHLGRIEELVAWAGPQEFELAFINTATSLAFPGAEAAARLGIPAVWAIHESFTPAILWADLEPEVRSRAEATLSGAAGAIFEAEATQQIFEPLLGAHRSTVLPYGLDFGPIKQKREDFDRVAARRQADIPIDAEVLLCVGTIEPRKAQILLAQAFDRIAGRHPNARLVFVGGREDDPHSTALEDYIESSEYTERIDLIPVTPNVQRWYGLADILVCASDIESLPRTVLEAMAWETPVLATDVFGLPELITDGETGWLCESRDMEELSKALDRALSSTPEQRAEIGCASRSLVERRHSLDLYAHEVASLLQRVTDNSTQSSATGVTPKS